MQGQGTALSLRHFQSVFFGFKAGASSDQTSNKSPDLSARRSSHYADPTRPVHYEGAQNFVTEDRGVTDPPYVDVMSRMYATPTQLKALAERHNDDRPIMLCEYAHSMGNSTGNLQRYWTVIRNQPRVFGAFIWDWIDQGLVRTAPSGETYWAYEGDFGEHPSAGNFNINGVVFPDRSAQPALDYQSPMGYEEEHHSREDREPEKPQSLVAA